MAFAPKSKLYDEMLAKFGEDGMAKPMTFGRAVELIGTVQDNAIKAHVAQKESIEALAQRVVMLEQQQGYQVTGTDKAGRPRVKALK